MSTALSFCRYGISNDGKTRVLLGNFTITQATQPCHPVPCCVEKSPPCRVRAHEYPNALALRKHRNPCAIPVETCRARWFDSPRSLICLKGAGQVAMADKRTPCGAHEFTVTWENKAKFQVSIPFLRCYPPHIHSLPISHPLPPSPSPRFAALCIEPNPLSPAREASAPSNVCVRACASECMGERVGTLVCARAHECHWAAALDSGTS